MTTDESSGDARLPTARQRRVTFSNDCKPHDGLRPSSRLLQALVAAYFDGRQRDVDDVCLLLCDQHAAATSDDGMELFQQVGEELIRLCSRVASLPDKSITPVLACGGGRHNVTLDHLLQLESLRHGFTRFVQQRTQRQTTQMEVVFGADRGIGPHIK